MSVLPKGPGVLPEKYIINFPNESYGKRETDNPAQAIRWFEGYGINLSYWPQLILAKDKDTEVLTWHWVCDNWNYLGWLRDNGKSYVSDRISMRRQRDLESLELVSRTQIPKEFRHYFLKEEYLNLNSYTEIVIS